MGQERASLPDYPKKFPDFNGEGVDKHRQSCYSRKCDGERSQVVKAEDCGSSIRGFESHRSPFI